MDESMWRRAFITALVVATATGGATAAAAADGDRLTGADPAHGSDSVAAASTYVPLPDLGIAHRLPSGGMNLWRMPLSDLESGFAQPQLVKKLDFGGFSYDNSVTLAGDVADVTPSDDGTADHIIWHAQPNGGVLLWAVGGGGDTTPRLWQDLRTGGWSFAKSTPMVGDVNGDGWDDLVVQHANGYTDNIWVFLSDGYRLGAPQLWWNGAPRGTATRYFLTDIDEDSMEDLVRVTTADTGTGPTLEYTVLVSPGRCCYAAGDVLFRGPASEGWSFDSSRQLAGDVTGDGVADILTVHAQPNGGILVWMHQGCLWRWPAPPCFQPPVVWQDLRAGGWSYAGSRQYLADTNGDGVYDLVSVHRQVGNPGELFWRHVSTGSGLLAPQVIADLRTGGWTYAASRESLADIWGLH